MKHLSEFWRSTLRYTLATFIGIVLTFGTAFAQQRYGQKKTERMAVLMVIGNLNYFCESLDTHIKDLEKRDSLNQIVYNDWETDKRLPEDTLRLFIESLLYRDMKLESNTAELVFSSNIEKWINIDNGEFIEMVGNCFAFKHHVVKIRQEMDEEKQRLISTCMKTMVYTDNPIQSVQERVDWIFRSPEFCWFIRGQHQLYISMLKLDLMMLQELNERNKQRMQVTNEELKEFGLYTQKEYDPTPSDDSE